MINTCVERRENQDFRKTLLRQECDVEKTLLNPTDPSTILHYERDTSYNGKLTSSVTRTLLLLVAVTAAGEWL
jgi:hypothetical protein